MLTLTRLPASPPSPQPPAPLPAALAAPPPVGSAVDERLEPMRVLLMECSGGGGGGRDRGGGGSHSGGSEAERVQLLARSYASLPELRDALLRIDPLNVEHVKKVNC